ncbi:MAG: alanine-zipper protein [Nevskia sp.]|nr:alanine-zipper protein [Nevskia sp.]
MRSTKLIPALLLSLVLLGACATLSDQDRALLDAANRNAAAAKETAQHALDVAQSAQASVSEANAAANRAAAEARSASDKADQAAAAAKTASEKADRVFQHSLRK